MRRGGLCEVILRKIGATHNCYGSTYSEAQPCIAEQTRSIDTCHKEEFAHTVYYDYLFPLLEYFYTLFLQRTDDLILTTINFSCCMLTHRQTGSPCAFLYLPLLSFMCLIACHDGEYIVEPLVRVGSFLLPIKASSKMPMLVTLCLHLEDHQKSPHLSWRNLMSR